MRENVKGEIGGSCFSIWKYEGKTPIYKLNAEKKESDLKLESIF